MENAETNERNGLLQKRVIGDYACGRTHDGTLVVCPSSMRPVFGLIDCFFSPAPGQGMASDGSVVPKSRQFLSHLYFACSSDTLDHRSVEG